MGCGPRIIAMVRSFVLQLLVLTKLITASDELVIVREREDTLANAVNAKDKAVLSTLTDKDFHLSWSYGSAIRNFRTDVSRDEWLEDVSNLRIESYEVEISRIYWTGRKAARPSTRLPGSSESPFAAYVTLREFWTLLSPRGRRIEKRVETVDIWIKQRNVWKLSSRLCQSDFH